MEGSIELRNTLEGYLSKNQSYKGSELICAQKAGSFAYNLNVATSDEDFFGVYKAPIELVLQAVEKGTICSHDPDFETHELECYLLLVEKGSKYIFE